MYNSSFPENKKKHIYTGLIFEKIQANYFIIDI